MRIHVTLWPVVLLFGMLTCCLASGCINTFPGDELPVLGFDDIPKPVGIKPSITFQTRASTATGIAGGRTSNATWERMVQDVLEKSELFSQCRNAERGGDYHFKIDYYDLPLDTKSAVGAAATGSSFGLIPSEGKERDRITVQVYKGEEIVSIHEYENYLTTRAGFLFVAEAKSFGQLKQVMTDYRRNFLMNFLKDFAVEHLGVAMPKVALEGEAQ